MQAVHLEEVSTVSLFAERDTKRRKGLIHAVSLLGIPHPRHSYRRWSAIELDPKSFLQDLVGGVFMYLGAFVWRFAYRDEQSGHDEGKLLLLLDTGKGC